MTAKDVSTTVDGAAAAALKECEDILARDLDTFIEVGEVLCRIRDERLYLAAGYDSFDRYCRERWDLGRSRIYQLIAAHEVVRELPPDTPQPANEAQARALKQVKPEDRAAVMEEAVRATGGKLTAQAIKDAASKPASTEDADDEFGFDDDELSYYGATGEQICDEAWRTALYDLCDGLGLPPHGFTDANEQAFRAAIEQVTATRAKQTKKQQAALKREREKAEKERLAEEERAAPAAKTAAEKHNAELPKPPQAVEQLFAAVKAVNSAYLRNTEISPAGDHLELKPDVRGAVGQLYTAGVRNQIKLLFGFLNDAGLLSGLLGDAATIMVDGGLDPAVFGEDGTEDTEDEDMAGRAHP